MFPDVQAVCPIDSESSSHTNGHFELGAQNKPDERSPLSHSASQLNDGLKLHLRQSGAFRQWLPPLQIIILCNVCCLRVHRHHVWSFSSLLHTQRLLHILSHVATSVFFEQDTERQHSQWMYSLQRDHRNRCVHTFPALDNTNVLC